MFHVSLAQSNTSVTYEWLHVNEEGVRTLCLTRERLTATIPSVLFHQKNPSDFNMHRVILPALEGGRGHLVPALVNDRT